MTFNPRLAPNIIQQEIELLLRLHPELEEDEILRADSIEGETAAFEFLSRMVRVIGATQALASGTADYIGKLQERKARLERRELALRSLIFKVMNTADLRKAELPEATLVIKNGSPRVVIINEREIPPTYLRVKTEPDKTKIKAALSNGQNVLGAALSNSEPILQISIR